MITSLLLVDDHALFLESLRSLLTTHGYQVVGTAPDGLEALAQARALRPSLILMDITMPRCNGLAATRLIKAEMPDIQIVMLTASEEEADLFEAIKSGASGYLLKSQRAPEFIRLLAGFERGNAALSPGLALKILAEFAHAAPSPRLPAPEAGETEALTARQSQILTLVAQGQTYNQVADTLCLSEATIRYHMREILHRLHMQNRAQAIAYAAQLGLIPPLDGPAE
jgi:two-component system NarL family response regulator